MEEEEVDIHPDDDDEDDDEEAEETDGKQNIGMVDG